MKFKLIWFVDDRLYFFIVKKWLICGLLVCKNLLEILISFKVFVKYYLKGLMCREFFIVK